ncbi:c-type cytochrome [Variovorax sp. AFSI2.2]|uniref:c-type cytochrome n=1 Tax=Variovorax sp. AFSI2.2 TaxID=3384160 RepID=UPI003EBF2119
MTIRWMFSAAWPRRRSTRPRVALLAMLLAVSACGEGPVPALSALDIRQAESLRPASADLRARYERSCMACHTSIDAKAPLTGAVAQWKPRLDKGIDLLVKHAMEGFNAMPPRGLCADCDEAHMRALIVFMSQGKEALP